jgi:membrane protease YdiL (CAAX protease family)
MFLALLFLLTAVFFDYRFFKNINQKLFAEFFSVSTPKAVFGGALIGFLLIFSEGRWGDLSPLVFLLTMPVYLLRRGRLSREIEQYCLLLPLEEGGPPRPGVSLLLSDALGVIIGGVYGMVVFDFFLSGVLSLFRGPESEMTGLIISAVFSSVLGLCLVYRASQRFSDKGFLTNVGLRKGDRAWTRVVLVPCVLGVAFAFFASYLAVTRQVQPQTPLNEVLESTESLGLILTFFFMALITAPLIEEIIFRGYFYRVVKRWAGPRRAIYAISLTFAVLHVGQYWGDWLAIAMVGVLGFTLTVLRAWTGTTFASVVTHYVYNGGVTVIPIIMMALSNPAYFEYKVHYADYDRPKKEALLQESIRRQPDLADAYHDLARLYADEDIKLAEALTLVEKALSYAPGHQVFLDTKTEILEKLRKQ